MLTFYGFIVSFFWTGTWSGDQKRESEGEMRETTDGLGLKKFSAAADAAATQEEKPVTLPLRQKTVPEDPRADVARILRIRRAMICHSELR